MSAELRWSATWADVVGADGPVITDLIGRVIPHITEQQRGDLADAHRQRHPTEGRMALGMDRAWHVATANGLRSALACALQSADRALRTHITGPVGSDDWHRWMRLDNPVDGVIAALVVRRHDPTVAGMAAPWETVMGALPALDDLAEADGALEYCLECKRPTGARYVTEAEAARYARHLHGLVVASAHAALEREDETRRMLADGLRGYARPADLRMALDACLDWPGVAVPPKVRRHIEHQFAIRFPALAALDAEEAAR
jgi:hypothetical protein